MLPAGVVFNVGKIFIIGMAEGDKYSVIGLHLIRLIIWYLWEYKQITQQTRDGQPMLF